MNYLMIGFGVIILGIFLEYWRKQDEKAGADKLRNEIDDENFARKLQRRVNLEEYKRKIANEEDAIHSFFGLSYAQYLTIPRSKLQSMSKQWQKRFVKLLDELDDKFGISPKNQNCYWVKLRDSRGRFVHDDFADYQRGRRQLKSLGKKLGKFAGIKAFVNDEIEKKSFRDSIQTASVLVVSSLKKSKGITAKEASERFRRLGKYAVGIDKGSKDESVAVMMNEKKEVQEIVRDDEKSDSEIWKEIKEQNREKRWTNHEQSRKILVKNEVEFIEKPNSHFIIGDWHFWGTTGKIYNIKTGKKSRGIFNLLKLLGKKVPAKFGEQTYYS